MPPEPCSPDELARILAGSVLDGRPIEWSAESDGTAAILWIRCRGSEVPAAWEAARAVLDRTGRWPVALWEVVSFDEYVASAAAAFDVVAQSEAITGDDAALWWRSRRDSTWLDLDDEDGVSEALDELAMTHDVIGDAPDVADVGRSIGRRFTDVELQHWLFEWEGLRRDASSAEYLDWFEDEHSDHAIAFTPVADGPRASAFFPFFGAEAPGEPERLVALLRRWDEAWGAELVASYTTMLQFVVRRPPRDLHDAWSVALEQYDLAPCTTLLPGIAVRQHARDLIDRDRWFLHERP